MNTQEIEQILRILASCTTLLAFLGVAFKPLRNVVGKWMADIFTEDIKREMVVQVGGLREELSKDRALGTRRHRSNLKTLRSIKSGMRIVNNRLDDHIEELHK